MRSRQLCAILAAFVILFVGMTAIATDWYVDPVNGSDTTGDGSEGSPWKTITCAVDRTSDDNPCALHLAAGIYSPSSNGETIPIVYQRGGASLLGSGADVTIIDAEGIYRVLEITCGHGTLADLTITGGDSTGTMGGGVAASSDPGPLVLERCVIRDNNKGAGLYTYNWTHIELTDCRIVRNNDDSSGGGIGLGLRNSLRMTNCLIADNTIPDDPSYYLGGGIMTQAGNYITLINCTVVNNHKQGLLMHSADSGRVTLYNCIFWGNDDDLDVRSTELIIRHCNISDGDGLGENGNISEEPLFVTGAQGDEYLSHYDTEGQDSPCIDAGDRNASELGLDKYTTCTDGRPDTGIVDMGYHYSVGPELSDPTHAPDSGRSDVNFTFTVHYYSPAGSQPSSIEVVVNGTAHGMSLQSGGAANGTYSWTGTIPEDGQATYHFEATDSLAQYVRHPASGELDGPMVYDDYVKPQSSCTAPGITNSDTIDVDYTSTDDNSGVASVVLWMQFDGHGYYDSGYSSTDGNGSFTVDLGSGDGTYDFYTIATDRATNEENAPGPPDATTVFDSTPPTSSASCEDSTNSSPIDVDFTANDALTGVDETALWYRYAGGSWTDSGQTQTGDAGTFSFEFSDGDGTYEFYTISTDVAGNVEAAPGTADCSVFYDCTAPVSSCDCSRWVKVREWIYVWFTASDNLAGLDSIALWYRPLPSGSWTEYDTTDGQASGSFSFNLPGGVNDVELYTIATDNAGNVEAPGDADCELGYDAVKPESDCSSPVVSKNTSIPVDFTSSDDRSGVDSTTLLYKYEDGGWGTSGLAAQTGTSGQFPFVAYMGDGTYYFATRAQDNAGNQEDFPAAADSETVLDTTVPVSSCSVDVEYTSAATISVQYSASDALTGVALVRLFVSRDGSAWGNTGLESGEATGAFTYDFAGLDGTYRFVTVATDGAGNVESISAARACTVVFDTGLPSSVSSAPEVENDPTIEVAFEITDALSGAYGVELYVCFSTAATASCTGDWEYTGEYEYGTAGSISYEPAYGAGIYRFFTIALDKAGNFEAMKDTADCITDYNPDYALSSCWGPDEASAATVAIDYATDIGEAGYDHVELWYSFAPGGVDWPDEWLDSGVTSEASEGMLVFEMPHGDGYYRFCTIALNEDLLAEPFPSACDCEVLVDSTVPFSAVSGPSIAGSLPVTVYYDASDQGQEGHFLSGVKSVEVWYSFEGSNTLYETIEGTPATIATGSLDFAPAQEGIYTLWSICTDAFGNREPTPPEPDMELAVDLAPPVSSVSAPQYSTAFPVQVSVLATDAVTLVTNVSVYYSLDGADWALAGDVHASRGTLAFTPNDAVEGVYGFISVGTDAAGHEEAMRDVPDAETTVDWTVPESSCSSPAFSNSTAITVTYEASDGGSGLASVALWYKFGQSGTWTDSGLSESGASGSFSFTAADGQGTYYFQTKAQDNAGNVEAGPSGSGDDATIHDATAPSSGCSSPTYSKSSAIEVTFTASDTGGSGLDETKLYYKFGQSGTWTDSELSESGASGSFSFTAAGGQGTYYFQTKAQDNAGNVEAGPSGDGNDATIYDATAPSSGCSSPTYSKNSVIEVTFTASDTGGSGLDETKLYYKFGTGSWTDSELSESGSSGSFDFTAAHGEGTYYFQTVAEDTAGNVEADASGNGDSSTVLDTTPPESVATAPGQVAEVPFDVEFTASDGGSGMAQTQLRYRFNGGSWQNYGSAQTGSSGSFEFTAPDGEGTFDFYTVATDNAGNVEAAPAVPDCTTVYMVGGALQMSVWTDSSSYAFGDDVAISLGCTNSGSDVNADVYVVMVYNWGGDGERFWSPVGFGAWTEGILPWLTSFELPHGFNVSMPAWSLPVPNDVPNLARSGDYTLLAGATEPGTLDAISNIAAVEFSIGGEPFITLSAQADSYALGDTLNIGLHISAPHYDVDGDVYLALLDPEGAFWSPVGPDWAWAPGLEAFLPSFTLPAGLELTLDGLWQIPVTGESLPFNRHGDYMLLAGMTESGTLTLWCDIGEDSFVIE